MTVRSEGSTLERDGFEVVGPLLAERALQGLLATLPRESSRRMLDRPAVRSLAGTLADHALLREALAGLVPVQAILFVKTHERNWLVPPHRDEVLPIAGEGPWPDAGVKEGLPSVRADRELLDRCVAVRVSLDDVPEGDIAVIPGSHRHDRPGRREEAVPVVVPRGGAALLRPSTVHSSSKLTHSLRRRVLHLLYGPPVLPYAYRWSALKQGVD